MWRVALAARLGLAVLAVLSVLVTPFNERPGRMDGYDGAALSGWADRLFGVWTRWDGQFYLKIAAVGHNAGDNSSAFYPLYPALIKAVGTILAPLGNLRYIVAAEAISAAAFIAALLLLHAASRDLAGGAVADKTILYTAAFPTAFFFWAAYSESLFLLLTVGSLYAARKGRWWLAGLAAALAIFTRVTGVVLLAALFAELLVQWWRRRQAASHPPLAAPVSGRTVLVRDLKAVLALLLPLSGLFALLGYYQLRVGDPLAFANVQKNWLRRPDAPWDTIWRGIEVAVKQPFRYGAAAQSYLNLGCTLLFLLLAVVGWRWLPLSYSVYLAGGLAASLLNPASAEPLLSLARFVIVLWPGFILLGMVGQRSRSFHLVWVVTSLLLLGLLFSRFANWWFVA